MTILEAVARGQGRSAGPVDRLSVRYAEGLLEPGETVLAAMMANVSSRRGRFPGAAVLTDRRIFAACGLPGIRRAVSCPFGPETLWEERPGLVTWTGRFGSGKETFAVTVDPVTGERFSRELAVRQGREAEFDAAGEGIRSGIFDPAPIRGRRRARRAKERARQARTAALARSIGPVDQSAGPSAILPQEAPRDTARRLAEGLDRAKSQGPVPDTDPRAVAARLAAELAGEKTGEEAERETGGEAGSPPSADGVREEL